MRIFYLFTCILGLVVAAVFASYDCKVAKAETVSPRTSKLAIFLYPVRKFIDFGLKRREQTPKKDRYHLPWTILTIPPHASQTDRGWDLHIHGLLYKRQHLSNNTLNRLADRLLIGYTIKRSWLPWQKLELNGTEADNTREMMQDIAVLPIKNGIIGASLDGCDTEMILSVKTNAEGSFDGTLTVPEHCVDGLKLEVQSNDLKSVNVTLQPVNVGSEPDERNFNTQRAFLVPKRGVTIISDQDDVLKVGYSWNWKRIIMNLLAQDYEPWRNMPSVLRDLKGGVESEGQNVHLHYVTDALEQTARGYLNGT